MINNSRYYALDVLRGVAIILVLGRHLIYLPDNLPNSIRILLTIWKEIGWIGVDLFFVLSGFLVSGLLFKEHINTGNVKIFRFIIRRGFKIYPTFYVFLLLSILTNTFLNIPPVSEPIRFVWEALFVQNYLGGVWNHTWSLAVEEHFYLLLSLIVFLLTCCKTKKYNLTLLVPLLVLSFAFTLLIRSISSSTYYDTNRIYILSATHFRIDSLLYGVLLSYLYQYRKVWLETFIKEHCILNIVLSILPFIFPIMFQLNDSRFMYTIGFTFLYLGFGSLLLFSLTAKYNYNSSWIMYLLAQIGRRSYSIYIWHMLVYWLSFVMFTTEQSLIAFYLHTTSYILGSVLVGIVSTTFIEAPFLRIREKYFVTSELKVSPVV